MLPVLSWAAARWLLRMSLHQRGLRASYAGGSLPPVNVLAPRNRGPSGWRMLPPVRRWPEAFPRNWPVAAIAPPAGPEALSRP